MRTLPAYLGLLAILASGFFIPAFGQVTPANEREIIETVIGNHDGDTLTIARRLEPYGLKIAVRIIGIDTPEINGAKCIREKLAGIAAQKKLEQILDQSGRQIILRAATQRVGWDRHGGRIDATVIVWLDGREQDVADVMINAGYGVAYSGGKARIGRWCDRNVKLKLK
jgi:endonuclease YncB( thermonuclease family)